MFFSVVGLKGIVLSEISQRVSNTERYHLHVKSKRVKFTETEPTEGNHPGLGVGGMSVKATNLQLEDEKDLKI